MASSPVATQPVLDYEHEEERLLAAVTPFVQDGRVRFDVVEDGTLEALAERLQREAFDVVYLSSHGIRTDEGPRLVLEDAEGARRDASPKELLEVLASAAHQPSLVVLSSCHSADAGAGTGGGASFVAELVARGVPAALGWQRPVLDTVATDFGHNLIHYLAQGASLARAVAHARSRLVAAAGQRGPSGDPSHAWATLTLVSRHAGGFRLDPAAQTAPPPVDREALYRWLGEEGQIKVLEQGFVGRRRELQRLLRLLRSGQDRGVAVAGALIWGNKGQGKSCLAGRALERLIHAFGEGPEGVGAVLLHGRVDALQVLAAVQRLAESWEDENAQEFLKTSSDEAFTRVRKLLRGHWRRQRVVLVLDDFEQNLTHTSDGAARLKPEAAELLAQLVPVCQSRRSKLLVTCTSRFDLPEGSGALTDIALGGLEPSAVRKLWVRGQGAELAELAPDEWSALAERLGRNARVLDWARTLLAGRSPADFNAIVGQAENELPDFGALDSEEERSRLAAMFLRTLAFQQTGERAPDVEVFLKRARVYDVLVPASALAGLCEGLVVNLERDLTGLVNLGLLEVGTLGQEHGFRVSPLVEAKFSADEPARWHAIAAEFWANQAQDFDSVRRAWTHALAAGREDIAAAVCPPLSSILHHLGLYRESWKLAQQHLYYFPDGFRGLQWACDAARLVGEFDSARRVMLHAEEVAKAEEIDGPTLSRFLYVGGRLLEAQSDYSGAHSYFERALALDEVRIDAEAQRDTAVCLQALAGVAHAQGELSDACVYIERAIAIHNSISGRKDNLALAAFLGTHANILRVQGKLSRARLLLERSLELKRTAYGTDVHPDIAASLHALAIILKDLGFLSDARACHERALAIRRDFHGTDNHPAVAISLHLLAVVLRAEGDLPGARVHLERSLASKLAVYGTDEHDEVAVTLHELGGVCACQGDLVRARSLLERSLAIQDIIYNNDEHLNTSATLLVLARVLKDQGDLTGARKCLERGISILMEKHGTDRHPAVATSLDTLANLEFAEGHPDLAISTFERCLAIREHCFDGREHFQYAESELSLANALAFVGRKDEAQKRLWHALSVLNDKAPTHPALRPPSLAKAFEDWRAGGERMDVFTMVINVACSLVVGSVLAVLPISREVVASDLEFLAGRPVPIPGIRPFLLLLRDLVTRDASVEDVASWRETLTPAFARRLTEVNISICEMRSELRCTTREARAPTYEVQLD